MKNFYSQMIVVALRHADGGKKATTNFFEPILWKKIPKGKIELHMLLFIGLLLKNNNKRRWYLLIPYMYPSLSVTFISGFTINLQVQDLLHLGWIKLNIWLLCNFYSFVDYLSMNRDTSHYLHQIAGGNWLKTVNNNNAETFLFMIFDLLHFFVEELKTRWLADFGTIFEDLISHWD